MNNPDYSVGKHPWPGAFSVPKGCQPIGLEDGIAYFFDGQGIICNMPISVLETSQAGGYEEGLAELADSGVTFAVLAEIVTRPLSKQSV